jgi:subtilisin family serine protease
VDKPESYWRSNLRVTFEQWNVANTVVSVVAFILVALSLVGLVGQGWQVAVGVALAIALLLWIPLLFLVITPVRMWNAKERIIQELREELRSEQEALRKDREAKMPDLVGTIYQTMSGSSGENPLITGVFVNLGVLSRGAPSIVDQWIATATISGVLYQGQITVLPKMATLHRTDGSQFPVYGTDAIYEKGTKRVETGDQIRGWLFIKFLGVTSDAFSKAGTILEISFQDYLGRSYNARHVFDKSVGLGQMQYFPGSGPSGRPPAPPPARKKRG